MKKRIALTLSSLLLIPSVVTSNAYAAESTKESLPVSAQQAVKQEAAVSKEKAIAIAKQAFTIPSNYKQTQIQFHSNGYRNASTVWSIQWDKQEEKTHAFIRISVDAQTGKVVSIQSYTNPNQEQVTYPPQVDRKQAKQKAEQFLKKSLPEKANKFIYDDSGDEHAKPPLQGDTLYYFTFNQNVNGIPFSENYVQISVNGNGDIVNFEYQWFDDYKFPSKDGLLSSEQALEKIKQTLPIELQYQTIYSDIGIMPRQAEENEQTKLAFSLASSARWFHAETGEWIMPNGHSLKTEWDSYQTVTDKAVGDAPKLDKPLTSAQAEKQVKKVFDISDQAKLQDTNYEESEHNNHQAIWHLRWSNDDKSPTLWISASIDANTGEIIDFYQHSPQVKESQTKKISKEKAEEVALNKLKELLPHKTDKLAFAKDDMYGPDLFEQNEYRFSFERIHNGVPVAQQRTTLVISADTGKLHQFTHNWKEQEFPSTENVITKEKAKELFFKLYNVQLKYVLTNSPYEKENEQEIVPVYSLERIPTNEQIYLDAIEGAWISTETGKPYEVSVQAADIEGHWAEKELRLMVDYRALQPDKDGNIYPNKAITRGEMIKMLMLTQKPVYYYREMSSKYANEEATFNDVSAASPYYVYIEEAVRQGLLEKGKDLQPNEAVTRQELALLITKALGYENLIKEEGLFNLSFKDQEAIQHKGAAAIMQHLNIMNGVNGYFYPAKQVTRAEAAKSYYEYLKERGTYSRNQW